jgi:hypothetical protein
MSKDQGEEFIEIAVRANPNPKSFPAVRSFGIPETCVFN